MTGILLKAQNIFLIGPMGVGKTTIGRMLAEKFGLQFFDSDQEIEKRTGADIPWIFDVEGESGFRLRESSMIEELTEKSGIVLSTGGGSVLDVRNRKNLAARGLVIFLDTSLEIQLKRVRNDKKRPLINRGDRKNILVKMREERFPLYSEIADLTFFVGDTSSRKVTSGLVEKMQEEGWAA